MKLDADYVKEQSFNIASSNSMLLLDDTKITLSKIYDISKNILSQQIIDFHTKSIPFTLKSNEIRDVYTLTDKNCDFSVCLAPSINVTGSAYDFALRLLNAYKMTKGTCSFLICADYIIKGRKCYEKLYRKLHEEIGVVGAIQSKACEIIAKLLLATPFSLLGMRLYIVEFDLKNTVLTGKAVDSIYAVDIPYSSKYYKLLRNLAVKDIQSIDYLSRKYVSKRQIVRNIVYRGMGNGARTSSQYLWAKVGKTNDYIVETDASYGRLGTFGRNIDLELKEYTEDKIRKILEESFII